jgi:hypothetical protein
MVNKVYRLDVAALIKDVSSPVSREKAFRAFSRLTTGQIDVTDPTIATLIDRGFITEVKKDQ